MWESTQFINLCENAQFSLVLECEIFSQWIFSYLNNNLLFKEFCGMNFLYVPKSNLIKLLHFFFLTNTCFSLTCENEQFSLVLIANWESTCIYCPIYLKSFVAWIFYMYRSQTQSNSFIFFSHSILTCFCFSEPCMHCPICFVAY